MAKLKLNERELQFFNEEYQDDVYSELKRGKDFAFSYNEVQYEGIKKMAEEIAEKKSKKTGIPHAVRSVNFGSGDTERTCIVGWKIVPLTIQIPTVA